MAGPYPPFYVRVDMDDARKGLGQLLDGVKAVTSKPRQIGSDLPYAFGIETGRHRGGRLARRAGGAWMMQRGLAYLKAYYVDQVGPAIRKGAGPVKSAEAVLLRRTVETIRRGTPKRSGALAQSIHSVDRG
jgi:hypothetical protein